MLSFNTILLAAVTVHVIASVIVATSAPMRSVFGARKIAAIVATSIAFNAAQYGVTAYVGNDVFTLTVAALYL
ncbi:MAG: hypothetical protein ACO32I_06285, partial [Candidatus Limnocylindrus sp.]